MDEQKPSREIEDKESPDQDVGASVGTDNDADLEIVDNILPAGDDGDIDMDKANLDDNEKKTNEDFEADFGSDLMQFAELDGFDGLDEVDLAELEDAFGRGNNGDDSDAGETIPELDENLTEEHIEFNPEISAELEARMQAEIAEREEKKEKKATKSDLIEYLSTRRSKIQYHALWHLTFNVDDHASSKKGLYDALKEVTSKNAVEPLEEHKFYFGLGFILRLELNGKKLITFKDGKLTLDTNIENMQNILEMIGPPISERPIITDTEKKDMFSEFLKDDFLDDF